MRRGLLSTRCVVDVDDHCASASRDDHVNRRTTESRRTTCYENVSSVKLHEVILVGIRVQRSGITVDDARGAPERSGGEGLGQERKAMS